ncbi:MAG TPA: urease accessory protein UreF [Gammaproteobacteria bacterium]|nr:urease accessory protein UreF [Gammaproteobacteria bacterium]
MRRPAMDTRTPTDGALADLRLRQLTSATLPVGAFAYSQGLETAVELGWVGDLPQAAAWIGGQLQHSLARVEVPLLARLMAAFSAEDRDAAMHWSGLLLAMRDTAELRAQERALASAWAVLLGDLDLDDARTWVDLPQRTALALFALAATRFRIAPPTAAQACLWAWLEAQVSAAVRAVPLGHTAAQRLLYELAQDIPAVVASGLAVADADIGAAAPALAIASCRHETQYSRLFRS